jgi:fumarate hydratase subunit beta
MDMASQGFDPFGAGGAAHQLRAPLAPEQLLPLRAGDIVALSGVLYVARDAAHARMAEALAAGQPLSFDPAGQALYYMGPTPAPPGRPIGSCGPTTASRMDPYAPLLIERGLRVMLGKGYRSAPVKASMLQHGCVYLGAVEGMAALLARQVTDAEVIAYADLGPEAVLRLEVVDFPAVVVNDLHGGDLYISGPARWARGSEF